MYVIKKLPVLLPLVVSVILCALGIYYKFSLNELSFKLIISIIVFYFIGYYLRNFILKFLTVALKQNVNKARMIREYEEQQQND